MNSIIAELLKAHIKSRLLSRANKSKPAGFVGNIEVDKDKMDFLRKLK